MKKVISFYISLMNFFLFIFFFFFALGSPFLKGEETLLSTSTILNDSQPVSAEAQKESSQAFYAPDSCPSFQNDFNLILKGVLLQREAAKADFTKRLFPILEKDSFYKINDTTALSDHYITWGELGVYFTSIGDWKNLTSFFPENEWNHICEIINSHLTLKDGSYESLHSEIETQPAILPQKIFECYTSWRAIRYWCFEQLLQQEAAYENGLSDFQELPGAITTYCKKQQWWPIFNLLPGGTNYFNEILTQSPQIGAYCLATEGGDHDLPYRLASPEEIASWQKAYNDCSEMASLEKEGYGLLAINTQEMESQPSFKAQEERLLTEKKETLKAQNDHAIENDEEVQKKAQSGRDTIFTYAEEAGELIGTLPFLGVVLEEIAGLGTGISLTSDQIIIYGLKQHNLEYLIRRGADEDIAARITTEGTEIIPSIRSELDSKISNLEKEVAASTDIKIGLSNQANNLIEDSNIPYRSIDLSDYQINQQALEREEDLLAQAQAKRKRFQDFLRRETDPLTPEGKNNSYHAKRLAQDMAFLQSLISDIFVHAINQLGPIADWVY